MTESERDIVKQVVLRVREIAAKSDLPVLYAQIRDATKPLLPLVNRRD